MANNCVTNIRLVCKEKTPLQGVADILNSLREKFSDNPNCWWGQTWLLNLATLLYGTPNSFDEYRGYVDSDFNVCACLIMCGRTDASREPFKVTECRDGFQMHFSVVSAWDLPKWITIWLEELKRTYSESKFDYGFRSTDEFGGFHICHNPEIIGEVYEVYHEDGYCFNIGDEQAFLQNISEITGIRLTDKMKRDADICDFRDILRAVNAWNEKHEDDKCIVNIYQEAS